LSPRVLVTGAAGQIGSELVLALTQRYGGNNVIATDKVTDRNPSNPVRLELLDVLDGPALEKAIREHGIDTIYHLAAILSATGEQNPDLAWEVNMRGLKNVLDASTRTGVKRLFWPSSIGVFGPDAPKVMAPQETALNPTTMYGVTKVAGELLCEYYALKHDLDVRSVRYPGLISSEARPGGGTTDYAVEIFYSAIEKGSYTCFLREDSTLPMMYMPDALRGAIQIMEVDRSRVKLHIGYNLAAMSFSPGELAAEISRHIKDFHVTYSPDSRQRIADSWPRSIDDSTARNDWGWQPEYDLKAMASDMLTRLRASMKSQGKMFNPTL
jgi:nucleoside-diphosphate-sugar epimerase